jgi:hypothetical protein
VHAFTILGHEYMHMGSLDVEGIKFKTARSKAILTSAVGGPLLTQPTWFPTKHDEQKASSLNLQKLMFPRWSTEARSLLKADFLTK